MAAANAASDVKGVTLLDNTRYDITDKAWNAAVNAHRDADDEGFELPDLTVAALSLLAGVWRTGWGLGSPCGWIKSTEMKAMYTHAVKWNDTRSDPYLLAHWDEVLQYAIKSGWIRREYNIYTRAKARAVAKGH
jgi:hypothetical protein